MITVSAFRWVPPFAQGFVRDLRVRWALEEAGLAYALRLIGPEDQSSREYRALQPFGQVPTYEEDGLVLFESGAIVLHIAQRSAALSPRDGEGRARMSAWAFAALNTVEPHVASLGEIDVFCPDEPWAILRRPSVAAAVKSRLAAVSEWLGARDFLEDRFTAADLLMSTVLRELQHTSLLSEWPNLGAYRDRCLARPAFEKALSDQMAVFAAHAPPER